MPPDPGTAKCIVPPRPYRWPPGAFVSTDSLPLRKDPGPGSAAGECPRLNLFSGAGTSPWPEYWPARQGQTMPTVGPIGSRSRIDDTFEV
jgi:hypothetical protein